MALLEKGDRAPEIAANDQDGKPFSLDDYRGHKVLLYFYPKDDTPGCTTEACVLRDNFPNFKQLGVEVVGVSIDAEGRHKKFAEKHSLPFRLVADTAKSIVEAYGVWGLKKFMGREYMGTNRVSYLIDEEGRIEHIWPKVSPAKHADEVLAYLKAH